MKGLHALKQSYKKIKTLAIGFGDKNSSIEEIKTDLLELEDLVYSLDWELVGSTFQKVDTIKPKTLIGSGKIEEIKNLILETGAEAVVIDHPLTGIQLRNLTKALEVIVADRNQVIIDIFAKRAQTKEGKLQVELARLLDELPRMIGGWHGSLSRLGGGIGTRGPGESALETDRRTIRERIHFLRSKLEDVKKHRKELQKSRKSSLKIALIGYTNTGKSSLLEVLSGQETYVEDQLFATLDPLSRRVFIKNFDEAILTDTVGFINKIPTHLVEAFKATLEESADADLLLHVVDASDPKQFERSDFVDKLIKDFGWSDKPLLYVYNKVDLLKAEKRQTLARKKPFVFVSAHKGTGLSDLKNKIRSLRPKSLIAKEVFLANEDLYLEESLLKSALIDKVEKSSVGKVYYVLFQEKDLSTWKSYIQ